MITLASATTIYSGECLPVDLSELESLDNVVYEVVGNFSNLNGLTIELNGTIANICTVPNYNPDSFTIIFIDNSTKEVIKEVHHYSSGGGGTRYKTEVVEKNVTEYIKCDKIKNLEPIDFVEEEIVEKIPKEIFYFVGFLLLIIIGLLTRLYFIKRKLKKDVIKK